MLSKRSDIPEKILQELINGEKTLTELKDAVEISKQGVLNHLNQLEDEGMVKSRSEKRENGRVKVFSLKDFTEVISIDSEGFIVSFRSDSTLDPDSPLLGQVPQNEFREQLKKYLESIRSTGISPLSIVIYGSVARDEATSKSDIDAILLTEKWTEEKEEKTLDALSEVTVTDEEVDHALNPDFREYSDLQSGRTLMEEVRSTGVLVYTTEEADPTWKRLKKYENI